LKKAADAQGCHHCESRVSPGMPCASCCSIKGIIAHYAGQRQMPHPARKNRAGDNGLGCWLDAFYQKWFAPNLPFRYLLPVHIFDVLKTKVVHL